MFNMRHLAIFVVLELTIGTSMADICFEGTPLQTSRGPLFSVQGQESDGQLCATAVRDESEVDDEDFESFQYATFVLGAPVFGDGVAAVGADYTAVSDVVNFPEGSTNVTICVDLIFDESDVACEGREDFGIQLLSTNPAFNTVCNTPRAIATIEDSTVIHIGFTSSTAEVSENAGSVPLSVTRFSGTQNLNVAQVVVMEDPDTPGCLDSSPTIIYPCVAPRCSDGSTFDLTKDIESTAIPRLVDDDDVIDGHRTCTVTLAPFKGSICLFNITRENTTLVVRDNEAFFIAFSSDFYQEEEDKGGVNVTVQLRGNGNVPITVTQPVDFTLQLVGSSGGSPAKIGVDLPNITYTGSIPPGQSSTSVRIRFTPDDVYEDTEVFKLVLTPSGDRYNLIPPSNAIIQIADDDNATIQFPPNLTVLESDGELTFALLIEQEYEKEICVFVEAKTASTDQLSGDRQPATANEDFTPTRSEVCFRDNSRTSENFTVPILGASDNIPEFDEVFSVAVDFGLEADLKNVNLPRPAAVTNVDTSDAYVLQSSQSEYRVVEDTGGMDVTVTVDRPPAFDIPFCVVASVSGSGPEYATLFNGLGSDTLNREWNGTILSGETSFQFSISTVPDNFAELDEQFDITIEGKLEPKLVVVHEEGGSALVVIEDDDVVKIDVDFEPRVREGVNSSQRITFKTDKEFAVPFIINISFMDGSAESGSDYVGTTQQITFTQNDTVQVVSVPILNDGIMEEPETFHFIAQADSSVRINVNTSAAQGTVVIDDNEVSHFFDVTEYVVQEDSASLSVTIRRRGYLDRKSRVAIVPMNGSEEMRAHGPGDFPLAPVLATFGSGVEMMNFSVPITPDMISEHNETFSLQLMEIPSIVIDPDRGTTQQLVEDLVVEPDEASVIITDVNDIVCVNFSESAYSSSEGDGDKVFTVVAHKVFTYDFRVVVTVMEVTATFGTDYSNMSFELTFTPGVDRISESLSNIDDLVKEMNESVNLVLSVPDDNPRPVCIKPPGTATCTIVDNDDLSVQFEQPQYTVSEGNTITVNVVASTDFSTPFSVDISHDGSGDLTLSSDFLSFSPSSRTASVMLTATKDAIKELDESFTLSLAVTDPMSQDFGVELGGRSTATVLVQDTTEDIVCGFFPTTYTVVNLSTQCLKGTPSQ
jgi:hypothetical protein